MTKRIRQNFDLVGELLLLVTADVEIIKRPVRIEECHGEYRFNEDEVNVTIVEVRLILEKLGIDLTHYLSDKEKELIANELEVY